MIPTPRPLTAIVIIVAWALFFLIASSCGNVFNDSDGVNGSNVTVMHTYETDDTTFYNGEVLAPDKYHSVPLIVKDAKSLNQLLVDYNPECIGDVQDILSSTCDTLKTNQP